MFCEESYSAFPTLLSFITKLNSNQLNIKKKIDKGNFGKKYHENRKHKRNWKKNHAEKHYSNPQCFKEKKLQN